MPAPQDIETFSKVVEAFSRAPLTPGGWELALESLTATLGAVTTTLEFLNPATGDVRVECPFPLDANHRQQYDEHVFSVNPRVLAAARSGIGEFINDDIVPIGPMYDEYWDWLRAAPFRFFHGTNVINGPRELGFVSSHFSAKTTDAALEKAEGFSRLIYPHIINAVNVGLALSGTALKASSISERAFDGKAAFALLDRNSEILECSGEFEAAVAASNVLAFRRRRLVALQVRDRGPFERFLASALDPLKAHEPPRRIRLCSEYGHFGYLLNHIRLPSSDDLFSIFRPVAMITIVDLDRPIGTRKTEIAMLFDLTEREADIAIAIGAGGHVDGVAYHLAISTYTVRQHLKAIFQKLGIARQSELVKLIGQLG